VLQLLSSNRNGVYDAYFLLRASVAPVNQFPLLKLYVPHGCLQHTLPTVAQIIQTLDGAKSYAVFYPFIHWLSVHLAYAVRTNFCPYDVFYCGERLELMMVLKWVI
jgi:hypothetical protein